MCYQTHNLKAESVRNRGISHDFSSKVEHGAASAERRLRRFKSYPRNQ